MAIGTYKQILELQSENLYASLNLSVSLALFGDIPSAIKELEQTLRYDFENPDILLNLGNLYYLNNHLSESENCHTKTLRLGVNESLVLVNLCQTLRRLGDWQKLQKYESRLALLKLLDLKIIELHQRLHCTV